VVSLDNKCVNRAVEMREASENRLDWAENAKSSNMGVFAAHMIGGNDDLKNICINGLTETSQKQYYLQYPTRRTVHLHLRWVPTTRRR
jgi:hypothetical protein